MKSPYETNNTNDELRDTPRQDHGKPTKSEHPFIEIIRFAVIALIIVLPIRMFVAQPFIVSGASMEDTFHNNEYLIVDQLTYSFEEPQRGDVVIFRYPRDPSKFFIKRVIGIPHDTVTIEDNTVTITNEKFPEGMILDEPYLYTETDSHLTMTLGAEEYFVMGDNRNSSSDSRVWGTLREDEILGRALLRLFPVSEAALFPGAYDLEKNLLE